jgi:hypothetical protein
VTLWSPLLLPFRTVIFTVLSPTDELGFGLSKGVDSVNIGIIAHHVDGVNILC